MDKISNTVCIGIDPSMNSTGISLLFLDTNNEIIKEQFFIIKGDKLTKREAAAHEKYNTMFAYKWYHKYDLATADSNHISERWKTLNMIDLVTQIKAIVNEWTDQCEEIYIVQEGISYGSSIRTKSVFDLAGLNYLLRNEFILDERVNFTIATPSEIKKFTTGNGNCKKDQMVELFKITHPDFDLPKIDDVSDAYWMSMYAKKIMFEE